MPNWSIRAVFRPLGADDPRAASGDGWCSTLPVAHGDLHGDAIQRTALARDHDPAIAGPTRWPRLRLYRCGVVAVAAGAEHRVPSSLRVALAWIASAALIRHGVRPLLHISDGSARITSPIW